MDYTKKSCKHPTLAALLICALRPTPGEEETAPPAHGCPDWHRPACTSRPAGCRGAAVERVSYL